MGEHSQEVRPVYAGVVRSVSAARFRLPGPPRMRGGYPWRFADLAAWDLSAPHRWGLSARPRVQGALFHPPRMRGGYPKDAGAQLRGDPPRMRGGYPTTTFSTAPSITSAPHTRGLSKIRDGVNQTMGVRPAYAGVIPRRCGHRPWRRSPPRIRVDCPYDDVLPPRLRGLSDLDRHGECTSLFHPACAGIIPPAHRRLTVTPGPPRSRGDSPTNDERSKNAKAHRCNHLAGLPTVIDIGICLRYQLRHQTAEGATTSGNHIPEGNNCNPAEDHRHSHP